MEEDGRSRVRFNYVSIKTNGCAVDIMDHLHQDGVLSLDDMERVRLPIHTRNDAMGILIAMLLRKHGSFEPFCHALRETGSGWLVDKMKQTDLSNTPKDSPEIQVELDKLDTNINIDLLVQQIKHQAEFIEMLKSKNTQDFPINEMPDLKQAMEKHNLSERVVLDYVTYLAGNHPRPDSDATEIADSNVSDRRRSDSVSNVNFIETVAITTALDIISYLSCGELKNVEPPKNKYEATMRRTVQELITRNKKCFEQYINKIKDNEVSGIQFLFNVADEMFLDNQYNWGRIAALYAFCGWLAKHDVGVDSTQPHHSHQAIGEFLGYYISKELGPWINKNGGWDTFVDQFSENSTKSDEFWTVIGLSLAAVAATIAIATHR